MKKLCIILWDPGYAFYALNLEQQIDLLKNKVSEAYEKIAPQLDEETSVLFLCPEFTFLNKEKLHSSSAYTKNELAALEDKLSALVSNHPNLIISPGTSNVEKELDLTDPKKKEKYANYFHKHPDVKRTSSHAEKNLELALGRPAELDGLKGKTIIKNTAFFFSGNFKKRYSKKHPANERILDFSTIFYAGNASPFFDINGIRFGIEICYDHKMGALAEEQKKHHTQDIDVHIILSNVINIIPNKVANNKKNIVVVNCAGFTSDQKAKIATGVMVGDNQGTLSKINIDETSSSRDIWIYPVIEIPRLKNIPSPR